MDRAPECERRADRVIDRRVVENRQRARQAQTDGTHVRVGWGAKRRAAAAEDLRGGQQVRVDLEADDWFVGGHTRGWGLGVEN